MALNPDAVRVAGTGEVFVAPTDTAAPTSVSEPTSPWVGLGLTSTDGVQFTLSRDNTDLDAWQQSKVRVLTNAEPVTVAMTLLETTADSLQVVFGGGTWEDATTHLIFEPPAEGQNAIRSLVVRFVDGESVYLYYYPRVQIEGDVSFALTRTDAVGYDITFGVLGSTPRWQLLTDDAEITIS